MNGCFDGMRNELKSEYSNPTDSVAVLGIRFIAITLSRSWRPAHNNESILAVKEIIPALCGWELVFM